jgi:hypothetical protein
MFRISRNGQEPIVNVDTVDFRGRLKGNHERTY